MLQMADTNYVLIKVSSVCDASAAHGDNIKLKHKVSVQKNKHS